MHQRTIITKKLEAQAIKFDREDIAKMLDNDGNYGIYYAAINDLVDVVERLIDKMSLDDLLHLNVNGLSLLNLKTSHVVTSIICDKEKQLRIKNIESIYKERGFAISSSLTQIKLKIEPNKKYSQVYLYSFNQIKTNSKRRHSLDTTQADQNEYANISINLPTARKNISHYNDYCMLANIYTGQHISGCDNFLSLSKGQYIMQKLK
jgi:hypothetical protein